MKKGLLQIATQGNGETLSGESPSRVEQVQEAKAD